MLLAEIPGRLDLLSLHRRAPERYPFLLESVAGHPLAGRYDILFAFPQQVLESGRDGLDHAAFFERLNAESAAERCAGTGAAHGALFVGDWIACISNQNKGRAGALRPECRRPGAGIEW